jgi:hypothetical protein
MKQNTGLAALSFVFLVIVSGTCGAFLIATSSPETETDGTGSDVSAQYVGNYNMLSENFDSQPQNLAPTIPGWTFSGPVVTRGNEYEKSNPDDKKLFLGKSASATININDAITDPNRNRVIVEFDYKCSVESDYFTRTYASGSEIIGTYPNTYMNDADARTAFSYSRDNKVKTDIPFAVTFKGSAGTAIATAAFHLGWYGSYEARNWNEVFERTISPLPATTSYLDYVDQLPMKVNAQQIDTGGYNNLRVSWSLFGAEEGSRQNILTASAYSFLADKLVYLIYVKRTVPLEGNPASPSPGTNVILQPLTSREACPTAYVLASTIPSNYVNSGYYYKDIIMGVDGATAYDPGYPGTNVYSVRVIPYIYGRGLAPQLGSWWNSIGIDSHPGYTDPSRGGNHEVDVITAWEIGDSSPNKIRYFSTSNTVFTSGIPSGTAYRAFLPYTKARFENPGIYPYTATSVADSAGRTAYTGQITNYQTHHVMIVYDPVVINGGAIVVDGQVAYGAFTGGAPNAKTTSIVFETRKNWANTEGSWDTPDPAYNAGVTIDNVKVWYPSQPQIVDAETQITTRGATVKPAGDTYNGNQVVNLHAIDDGIFVQVTAKDLLGFFSSFFEIGEMTVKPVGSATSKMYSIGRTTIQPDTGNGNGIARFSGYAQISDIFSQFPSYANGDILEITIKVSNWVTLAYDQKTYYARVFRASFIPFPAFESGMSIDSGNVTASTVFGVSGSMSPAVTGYSLATTGPDVPKYEPYVNANRAGVNSTAKVTLITTPSVQYKIDVKFNATKINGNVPVAPGTLIGMYLHVPVRVQFNAQSASVAYTIVLKTDHLHFINENEAMTTVQITRVGGNDISAATSVTEDDMKAVDGIDVVVTVNDPTGIVTKAGGIVKIRGTVVRSGEITSNEKQMAMISPGIYTATVPTWWIDGPTEVTSVTLTAFIPTLPYQDEKTITVAYTKPDFAVDKPSLSDSDIPASYRQDDVLSLAIEYAEIFSTIGKIKVKLVETSTPSVALIDTQITNPSAVFDFVESLNAYVLDKNKLSIFPALDDGLYEMTITVFDTANFTATRTVSFTVSAYVPSVIEMKMVLPSNRNIAGTVFYGMLPVTVSINANSEMSDLISIKYKIVKTGTPETVIVPYGTTLPNFPGNPVFVNSTNYVKTKAVTFSFNSTYFDGSYKMTILVETYNRATKSSQFNEFAININPIGGIIFSVSQVRPIISWNDGYPGSSTYSSGNVDFAGSVTDANKDVVKTTLFYDIPGVANNVPLVLNPDGTFSFSIPTASFTTATNTITISARDSKMGIGEFITEPTRTFHVDTSAPMYDAAAIKNYTGGSLDYYTDGDVLNISATITDTKGLKYVGVTIKDTIFGTIVFQHVFHDGAALPAGTEKFKYDVAPGDSGELAISDSTMFNVQIGNRRAFTVEWLSMNDDDKESKTIETFVIDKRTAAIYSFVEGDGIARVSVSPASIIASISLPSGLSITKSGFIITSGEFSFEGSITPAGGATYAATFEMRDLDVSMSQYTMEIYVIMENGYRSSSKFTMIVSFKSPVITLSMTDVDFDQSNDHVDLASTVVDPNGDLGSVEYSVRKSEIGAQSPTVILASLVNGKYEGRFDFGTAYGSWIVTITATDLVGSAATFEFTIYRKSPDATVDFFIKSPVTNQIIENVISIDVEVIAGYDLISKSEYRVAEESSGWIEFTTVSSEENFHYLASVTATNFAPGTKTVQVRIEMAGGERKTAEVKVTKIAPIQENLDAPVLGAPVISGYNVTLSWSAVQGATGYQVYRVSGTRFQLVYASIVAETGKVTFSEILSPGQYQYAVAAYDGIGRGPLSNNVSVSITATQPSQSFFDVIFQSIQSFFGFIMMLFSSILGIFGIVFIRARNVNKSRGLDTSLGCMLDPNQAKCKIRDL